MTTYVYGKSTVATSHDGYEVIVREGDIWDADDPFVKQHPDYFVADPVPEKVNRTVPMDRIEQATAAPGEKRRG